MSVHQHETFARLVRRYRLALGLTQQELAERAGISSRGVRALEAGERSAPQRETVRLLAEALQLTAEERQHFEAAARRTVHTGAADSPPAHAEGEPARSQGKTGHETLPVQLTALIGRTEEIDRIYQLLTQPGRRLVTLTGPGGTGKTRLAIEAAGRLYGAYPDGVAFVGLASIQHGVLVPAAIAQPLGVREAPGRSLSEAIAEFIGEQRLLLLLDNCEHLLDACAELVALLLAACPQLSVLATSRTALHVRGEQVFPVAPLALPPVSGTPMAAIRDSPAVALFVERAAAVDPDFALSEANAPDIASICRQLDGLPLAIELAAARIGLFPPPALLERLADRLQLLTRGPRDVPARQQTLREAIDWSYRLLTPEEQGLFARLSVFAGGCTFEAAEAVCNPEGDLDLLEGMASLVDKSLLRQEGKAQTRFSMFETIGEYAAEKLDLSGQAATVRQRHAEYFMTLVEETSPEWVGPDLAGWLDRLETDHDNLRAALRWLLDAGGEEQALQLTTSLYPLWNIRCHYAEGQRWLEEGLARAVHAPAAVRATAFGQGCVLATLRGDYDRAAALGEEGLRLRRSLGDGHALVRGLLSLALSATQRLDYSTARNLLEESLARSRVLEYTRGTFQSLHNLGEVALNQGDLEQAITMTEESLELNRAEHDIPWLVLTLDTLARALLSRGELQRAASLWAEGLELARQSGDRRGIAYHLEGFAAVAAARGRPERSGRLAGAAQALRQEIHSPLSAPEADLLDRFLSPARTQLERARWNRAWDEGRSMLLEEAMAYASEEDGDR